MHFATVCAILVAENNGGGDIIKAVYHLPGLFEFEPFYAAFLPLYRSHRDWFCDWSEIGSIYGAPADCLWGGGRVGYGQAAPREVFDLMREYRLSPRLTFSNSLLREEHLSNEPCNALCDLFSESDPPCGIILCSDLLLAYLHARYPSFYFVSSTTKVLTDFVDLRAELRREEFSFVVPDFRLNHDFANWNTLKQAERSKAELLCNECCDVGCTARRACYENVSRKCLGENVPDHVCRSPFASEGYRFSRAMESPAFLSTGEIRNTYLPNGFSQFKLEGRNLGSAVLLELLLYYLTKPSRWLRVREELYLDSSLDLF